MTYIIIALAMLPIILVAWSGIDVRRGKREKVNWNLFIYSFIIIFALTSIVNIYLKVVYDFDIFPNYDDSMIYFILVGIFIFVLALVFIVTYFMFKNAPKSIFDPVISLKILGSIVLLLAVVFFWYMPIADKITMAQAIEKAEDIFEEEENDMEFSVALGSSHEKCIDSRNSRCYEYVYENLFYVKNNLDEPYEVQVKFQALNEDNQPLLTLDSDIMKMNPDEMRLVTTPETNDNVSEWSKYTFETEEKVDHFNYTYRYRRP